MFVPCIGVFVCACVLLWYETGDRTNMNGDNKAY